MRQPVSRLLRSVGQSVRQLRHERRLTQEDLAARATLAVRHLQKIEAGEVNMTLGTLARLASVLDVTPAAFFEKSKMRRPS
jgi:transcriptional regulator with XRE-family HTH domain